MLKAARRGAVFVTVAVVAMGLRPSAAGAAGGFSDAEGVHAYGIEQVARWGIDEGCGGGRFCPSDPISRAEMAAWLYKAATHLDSVHTPPPLGGAFHPDGTVTRGDAAVMLTAAFEHLAVPDRVWGVFADTSSLPEAVVQAIEGIHAAGLTKGCATGPLRYCPHHPITRGQTAAMLTRAIQRADPTVGLITNKSQAAQGYTLITPNRSGLVYLIDHLGRAIHTWKLPGTEIQQAKLLENGNLLIREDPEDRQPIIEVDLASNIVWQYTNNMPFHHDFLKLPNGNLLLLVEDTIMPEEAIALGAYPEISLYPRTYDYLLEVKPTGPDSGEVVWEWSMLDHLIQDYDPAKPDYGAIAGHPERIDINYPRRGVEIKDWAHINALDYNPLLNQIMMTVRHFSELWIIDHNTTTEEAAGPKGDLLYRWGNPRAYGNGDPQDQQLLWPHNAHWIPPGMPGAGNILIFNNGKEARPWRRYYSSVDEIILPSFEDNAYPRNPDLSFAFARPQWIYTAPNLTDFYSDLMGSVQRLPNGNTQICDSTSGAVFQVTPDGKTVWQYNNPITDDGRHLHQGRFNDSRIYRAPWYPPDYPGLQGMDLTPKGPIERYR